MDSIVEYFPRNPFSRFNTKKMKDKLMTFRPDKYYYIFELIHHIKANTFIEIELQRI